RLSLIARRQQALDDQLIRSVAGRGQECAADQSGPECVGLPEIEAEIKDSQLVGAFGQGVNGWPPARHQVQYGEQADDSSSNVDDGLHYVSPNHRCQSAFEGVDQG